MLLNIETNLVIFAVNKFNPTNTLVCLRNDGGLPQVDLHNEITIESKVSDLAREILGVTGSWMETTPSQAGFLADLPSNRLQLIYCLLLPEKPSFVSEGYKFGTLDNIRDAKTEAIVRFAALQEPKFI